MKKSITPQVGMGATQRIGSDSYPYTIVEVSENLRTIYATQDTPTPIKEGFDFYSNQEYTYEQNPEAGKYCYTLRKNGKYVRKGNSMDSFMYLTIGHRSYYQDPHF